MVGDSFSQRARVAGAFGLAWAVGCSGGNSTSTPIVGQTGDASTSPPSSDDTSEAGTIALSGDDGSSSVFQQDSGPGPLMCTAGTYAGGYSGINDSSKLGGPSDLPVSGPLSIVLVQTEHQAGEFLQVGNDGTFDAVWGGLTLDASAGLIVVQANLSGQLNCTDGDFSAMASNADWTILDIPAGDATVVFTGTYDPSSQSISGNFNITSALATSTGTWNVVLQPGGDD